MKAPQSSFCCFRQSQSHSSSGKVFLLYVAVYLTKQHKVVDEVLVPTAVAAAYLLHLATSPDAEPAIILALVVAVLVVVL